MNIIVITIKPLKHNKTNLITAIKTLRRPRSTTFLSVIQLITTIHHLTPQLLQKIATVTTLTAW